MRLTESFSFACPLKINCGNRALAHLPVELSNLNARVPLILANRDQVGKKRMKGIIDAFRTSGLTLGVYDRLPAHPEPELMPVLARMYRDGCCDSIIALGSGSVVDTAKCLNLMVSSDDFRELDAGAEGSADPGPLRPLMLVATTGGNGNEATGYANGGIRRFCSPRLAPDNVFIDPVMMGACNGRDLVDGALIGMAHAVEAFLDDSAGPMCRAYAHTAIGLIVKYLPLALRNTNRRKSLCAVVNGQIAAGCAFFASSPGICHTLASRLKEWTDTPVGFLMAILLPHLVEAAGAASPESVGELLYPMAGAESFAVTGDELKPPRTVALFWEFFNAVNAETAFKIPLSLGDTGLTDEQIENAQLHIGDGCGDSPLASIIDGARRGATMISG